MSGLKSTVKNFAQRALEPLGHTIIPIPFGGLPYMNCEDSIRKAKQLGMTIPEYYANTRNEPGVIENLFKYLDTIVPFANFKTVTEIGAGTGRFLELVKKRCSASCRHEVYETDQAWSAYLAEHYGVTAHPTRGFALDATADASVDLVHADYVFAYLPATTAFRYFDEICRVLKPGGYAFFDAYFDADCDLTAIREWMQHSDNYQIILPRHAIIELFKGAGCELIDDSHLMKVYRGHTRYLIFRKR